MTCLVLFGTFKDHWQLLMVQSFWTFLIPLLLFVHWLFLCRFTALFFVLSEKKKGNTFCVVNGNKSSQIKSTLQKKTIFELNDLCFAKFFGLHPPPLKRTKTATILLKGIVSKKKTAAFWWGNTIADNFWYFKSFSRICRQRDLAEILRVLYSTTSVEWIWSGRTSYSHS